MAARCARLATVAAATVGGLVVLAAPAGAHPLGNFTVNTFSGLVVHPEAVDVRFVLDMAEIPTFQRRAEIDTDADGKESPAEREVFRRSACALVAAHVTLRLDGQPLAPAVRSSSLAFPPGQAGLHTLRLTCGLRAVMPGGAGPRRLDYGSDNYLDRIGWREIAVAGDGVTVDGPGVRARSVSAELTAYPRSLLQAPLDERRVHVTVAPGGARLTGSSSNGGPATSLPRGVDRATRAFTTFIAHRHLTVWFALAALFLAAFLGALHAFAPGHGKTVMAAYLVGQEGSLRQAGIVALTVTLTHTAGVLALGVAISASAVVSPERLYPWLGLVSGVMLAAIGVGLLARPWRLARRTAGHDDVAHDHDHAHAHDHVHGGRSHSHGPVGTGQAMSWGSMLAMGFVGGFLPSPSAVVVILGAIALHRAWFGVVLVLAYGVGMALTLTGTGLLLLKTKGVLSRRWLRPHRRDRLAAWNRRVPQLAGVVIVVVGMTLAAQGLAKV